MYRLNSNAQNTNNHGQNTKRLLSQALMQKNSLTEKIQEMDNMSLNILLMDAQIKLTLEKMNTSYEVEMESNKVATDLRIVAAEEAANTRSEECKTKHHAEMEEIKVKKALLDQQQKTLTFFESYQKDIMKAKSQHDEEAMKTSCDLLAEKTKTEIEIMKTISEYQSNSFWNQYVTSHNQQLERMLPQLQKDFISAYTGTIEQRNGKVKNIEDYVVLPAVNYDNRLGYIVPGRMK